MPKQQQETAPNNPIRQQTTSMLPELCEARELFGLLLIGELLAIVLVVARYGLVEFNFSYFGYVSFFVLWLMLICASVLCGLRRPLARLPLISAMSLNYALVLLITALITLAGQHAIYGRGTVDLDTLFSNLLIAAVYAGIFMRYFYLQAQLHKQQQAETEARLTALQARIRPHFLFNSLNSIASLVAIDAEKAEQMVVDLAHLFRASMHKAGLLPLHEEITLCKRYVAIEKLRFGDRLQVNWQLDIEDTKAEAPVLFLQPLIENALVHGIQHSAEGGTIEIKVSAKAGEVEMSVTNPLPTPARTQQQKRSTADSSGMALDNIRNRLSAYFGSQANLRAEQSDREFSISVRYSMAQKGELT